MEKCYHFDFYIITPDGDWKLYLIKTTSVLGRRSLLNQLKSEGYVYDRKHRAYFQSLAPKTRFAVFITLFK